MNAFDRIAIDIVGPFPVCTKSGNRWLLTIMDLCTHFPEAILIPEHKTHIVCRVLTDVFARFGFPREVLTDQRSEFMSAVMQHFLDQCVIKHIKISAYHP